MSIFNDLSFFHAACAGVNPKRDPENQRLLNERINWKIKEMIKSNNPKIRTHMFNPIYDNFDLINMGLLLSVSAIFKSLYRTPLYVLTAFNLAGFCLSIKLAKGAYRSQFDIFLNDNYEFLDSKFKNALHTHDYRYIADYKPTSLSKTEMGEKLHRYFNIN